VACFGGVVFWLLNQADARGRKQALLRRRQGEYVDWP
jgi:hypothetical protein